MFFPEEVLVQILLRLPPKSLSRFKCVSKAWQAMIDSDQFMAEILQLTYTGCSSNHCLYLISQKTSKLQMTLISMFFSESEDEGPQLLELKGAPGITELFGDVSDPEVSTWYSYSVSSPINGMYCVNIIQYNPPRLQHQARLVRTALWNPGVGQFHILPTIPRPSMLDVFMDLQQRHEWDVDDDVDVRSLEAFSCGFVFDPVSQDYKLFSISQYGDNYSGPYYFVCFHLYSLASDSWQELRLSQITYPPDLVTIEHDGLSYFSPHLLMEDGIAVPLNGSCHWLYSDMVQTYVMSFDIVNHAFDETSFPLRMCGHKPVLTIVDGYLGIAGPPPVDDFESDPSMIDVSVVKEYGVKESWMKAYKITLKSPGRCLNIIKDKLFVQEKDDGWVVSYRLGSHQDDYHRYGHIPFHNFDILPLEGSLIPIHPIND